MKFFMLIMASVFTQQSLQCQTICDTSEIGKERCQGMTVDAFNKKVSVEKKLVFVNFKASWCAACIKQDQIINEIRIEKKSTLEFLIVDMDLNPLISDYFEVNSLPMNMLYKDGSFIWRRLGTITRQEILDAIRPFE